MVQLWRHYIVEIVGMGGWHSYIVCTLHLQEVSSLGLDLSPSPLPPTLAKKKSKVRAFGV